MLLWMPTLSPARPRPPPFAAETRRQTDTGPPRCDHFWNDHRPATETKGTAVTPSADGSSDAQSANDHAGELLTDGPAKALARAIIATQTRELTVPGRGRVELLGVQHPARVNRREHLGLSAEGLQEAGQRVQLSGLRRVYRLPDALDLGVHALGRGHPPEIDTSHVMGRHVRHERDVPPAPVLLLLPQAASAAASTRAVAVMRICLDR